MAAKSTPTKAAATTVTDTNHSQFTAQRFLRIENGKLRGQLRDVAYQATTTDF